MLHPSRDISKIIIKPISFELPEIASSGDGFLIPKPEIKGLLINRRFQPILLQTKGFFSSGLYMKSPLYVTRSEVTFHLFNHPVQTWEVHKVELKRTELKKGNKLKISKSTWKKVTADQELRSSQRKKARSIVKAPNGPPQLNCWKAPLQSKIVSRFGSPRYLPNGKGYYHSGVDLRGWTGTPIKSAADGEVVLAEHMIVPGNNVILSHGGGIYSRYMHLDKMKVKVGDLVKKEDVIGTSGSTGRVEGAHLHWEVYWRGHYANPHQFIKTWNQECS